MTEETSIYRKFPTLELAQEINALLIKAGIETELGDNVPPVDVTFSGSTVQNQIEIRIKPSDFKKADAVMASFAESFVDNIDKDYYLFQFTDEELYEVLLKSDEWGSFDYMLAQKILAERGKTVDIALLESLNKQRIDELAKPEGNQKAWIYTGYLFAFLGGFLGLIIGYFLWTSKKTLPNGEKVYSYSEKDRSHGKSIFFIGLILLPVFILVRVFLDFN